MTQKQYPKISIITPSLNQGQFLENTIRSIIDQEYPNLEYILIDGGSTDNSMEIIKKYESHFTYWISEKDGGQSEAINKGIAMATGDIINWINSDDYMEPGSLQQISEAFGDSNTQMCCGFAKLHWPDKLQLKRTANPEPNFARFMAQGHLMQPATFWRKIIFDQLTPLDESFNFMMDHHIWIKYLMRYGWEQVQYVDQLWVHVNMHDQAKSVKYRADFDLDKSRIIEGLIAAINGRDNCSVNFDTNSSLRKYQRGIKFYYLYDQLFDRDAYGERGSINLAFLTKLLLLYPDRLTSELWGKIIGKSNWSESIKDCET